MTRVFSRTRFCLRLLSCTFQFSRWSPFRKNSIDFQGERSSLRAFIVLEISTTVRRIASAINRVLIIRLSFSFYGTHSPTFISFFIKRSPVCVFSLSLYFHFFLSFHTKVSRSSSKMQRGDNYRGIGWIGREFRASSRYADSMHRSIISERPDILFIEAGSCSRRPGLCTVSVYIKSNVFAGSDRLSSSLVTSDVQVCDPPG